MIFLKLNLIASLDYLLTVKRSFKVRKLEQTYLFAMVLIPEVGFMFFISIVYSLLFLTRVISIARELVNLLSSVCLSKEK